MSALHRTKIFMGNLGYARGINGCLAHHLRYAHRHVYCPPQVQRHVLGQVAALIASETPDICCFVEIDKTARFNQLEALINDDYPHFDIENKYGQYSPLRRMAFTKGKSNAFVAQQAYAFEKIYFNRGTKRLIYKITLAENLTLFFAHFSLNRTVRRAQLEQTRQLMHETAGEVIFMGDFNVLSGLDELHPLVQDEGLVLLNKPDLPTFTFHQRRLVLDLCLCTPALAARTELRVVPQPYSDHAALIAEIRHD